MEYTIQKKIKQILKTNYSVLDIVYAPGLRVYPFGFGNEGVTVDG